MYFDPGTGSLLIQALVASLAVLAGYFAIAKTKLKNLFTKNKNDTANEVETENTTEDTDDTL